MLLCSVFIYLYVWKNWKNKNFYVRWNMCVACSNAKCNRQMDIQLTKYPQSIALLAAQKLQRKHHGYSHVEKVQYLGKK